MLAAFGIDPAAAETATPTLPRLSPTEMQHLPLHTETQIHQALDQRITRSEAAEPAVWALCHAVWIRRGCFGDYPAAAFCGEPAATTPDDTRIRQFLRHTGGLPIVRGSISVLVNCPVAAAFWRRLTALTAAEAATACGGVLDPDDAHKTLSITPVWERLAAMSLKQVTAVAAPRAGAAIIAALTIYRTSNRPASKAQIEAAIRSIGRLSHSRCLHLTDWETLLGAAQTGLAATQPT